MSGSTKDDIAEADEPGATDQVASLAEFLTRDEVMPLWQGLEGSPCHVAAQTITRLALVAAFRKDGVSDIRAQVEAFHEKFNHPVLDKPQVPSDAIVRKRLRFIAEEFFELLEASGANRPTDDGHRAAGLESLDDMNGRGSTVKYFAECVLAHLDKCEFDVDLPEFVDALADLDYMVEGTRLEFGVNGKPIAAEVHRVNLSKSTEKDANGKTVKPADFVGPDVIGELRRQGYKP